MSENHSGTITCRSFQDFYQALFQIEGAFPSNYNENLASFTNLVTSLPHGCNCTTEARTNHAKVMYKQMATILSEEDRKEIKEFFKVGRFILMDGDDEFFSF